MAFKSISDKPCEYSTCGGLFDWSQEAQPMKIFVLLKNMHSVSLFKIKFVFRFCNILNNLKHEFKKK